MPGAWAFIASRKVTTVRRSSVAPSNSSVATGGRLLSLSGWGRFVLAGSFYLCVRNGRLGPRFTKRISKWLQFAKYVARAHLGACRFHTHTCVQSAVGARIFSVSAPSSRVHLVACTPALLASSRAKSSRPDAKGFSPCKASSRHTTHQVVMASSSAIPTSPSTTSPRMLSRAPSFACCAKASESCSHSMNRVVPLVSASDPSQIWVHRAFSPKVSVVHFCATSN